MSTRKSYRVKVTCPVSEVPTLPGGSGSGSDINALTCGVLDQQCNDPAFAAAHPDLCGSIDDQLQLIIKPEIATVLHNGTVQYTTFARVKGIETQLTTGLAYTSSNPSVASVNGTTGLATGHVNGIVTITVTWHGYVAHAQLTVVTVCGSVAIVIVLDNSKSAGQVFGGTYSTKLAYAKSVASRLITSTDFTSSSFGVVSYNLSSTSFGMSADQTALLSRIAAVIQTTAYTNIAVGLQAAVDLLATSSATQKAIILASDGNQRVPTKPPVDPDPVGIANDFKATGGVIVGLGTRASGDGFALMQELASDGYFVNAYPDVAEQVADLVSGLRGYFCGGNCSYGYPSYLSNCLSIPPAAQAEDPDPLEDIEAIEGPKSYTETASYTACCTPNQYGDCVTRSATYTSTINQADAVLHAQALARSAAFAALVCCTYKPILIKDDPILGQIQPADPYPSCYKVTGHTVPIGNVKVNIKGLAHFYCGDVALLLVSPAGTPVLLTANAGTGPFGTGTVGDKVNITFDDGASGHIPTTGVVASGTYKTSVVNQYPLPASAPQGNSTSPYYSTFLSAFAGEDANGLWQLYVVDDSPSFSGSIDSWDLTINDADPPGSCDSISNNTLALTAGSLTDITTAIQGCGGTVASQTTWDGTLVRIFSQYCTWADEANASVTNFVHKRGVVPVFAIIRMDPLGNGAFRYALEVFTPGSITYGAWRGSKSSDTPIGRYYVDNAYGTNCTPTPAYLDVIAA